MDPKRARKSAKAQLSKIGNFLKTEAASATPSQLKVKLEILEKHYANFQGAQNEIESKVDENDLDKEIEESEAFDELYCNTKAELLDLLNRVHLPEEIPNPSQSNGCHNHFEERFFKLPTINLKPFNGNYLEWTPFKDMFSSMIGAHSRISDIDKFCLLKNSLEGEPLNMVKSLPLTIANYQEAWNMLEERYSNQALIVKAHISQIFSIEKCNGSASSLKVVLDTIAANVRALENLGLESSSLSDAILFHIVTSKLDQRSKELFDEERHPDSRESNYKRLLKFLAARVNSLADLPSGKDLQPSQPKSRRSYEVKANQLTASVPRRPSTISSSSAVGVKPKFCIDCKGNHPLFKCPQFVSKTAAERYEIVKNATDPICFNCFRSNHRASKCTDTNSCRECGQKHHTMLHFPKESKESKSLAESQTESKKVEVCTITQLATKQVLLATVSLLVKDSNGENQQARAFLDPGAQANLITKKLVNRLKLPMKSVSLTLTGVTNLKTQSNKVVECRISSRVSKYESVLHAVVVPQICSKLPSQIVSTAKMPLAGKELADPRFHEPGDIELLLCGEYYLDLFTDGHVPETDETPSMRNTVFGWIVAGKSMISENRDNLEPRVNYCAISAALEKFWSNEDIESIENDLTVEEKACEMHFLENYTRLANGRFEVSLPLKVQPSVLGDSRDIALKVLKYTQRRLNECQKNEYQTFMDECIRLGHMVKICNVDLKIPHAYLPHHPVIKADSKTTRLRVVFNGAKPTSNGISVNDIHMKGAVLQNDLFATLVRFRFHKVAVCADIEKMYRQVAVRASDQELQRVLWYDSNGEIADFKLTTVTYGLTSSSFLAVRCLKKLAEEGSHKFPLAASAINNDSYVDDFITGAASTSEAQELVHQLRKLLAKGQFTLRKWVSNQPSILQGLKQYDSSIEFLLNSDERVTTLGISWLPNEDSFILFVKLEEKPDFNKRSILSEISKIFDPLGLATPVVIPFKLFLRELWKRGCNWDDPLDPDLRDQWTCYRRSIMSLHIKCPRLVLNGATFEIHGFCDASNQAICACIYIRSFTDDGVHTRLLCSKSRVAPLRDHHIHRLELMGAVLLSRLLAKVMSSISQNPSAIYLWSDSQVTLAWLRKEPGLLKPFVGNRVKQIQDLTPSQAWHYVNTHENPADLGSRGATGDSLQNSSLWWNGPKFLCNKDLPIQPEHNVEPPEATLEFKKPKVQVLIINIAEKFNLFNLFESANKLVRVIAWWLRYMSNLRISNPENRVKSPLLAHEIAAAKKVLVRLAQQQDFDIDKLRRKGAVGHKSKLRSLAPFVDEAWGIIRVGGRLQNAQISVNQRHPMVLLSNHPFTIAIVREQHKLWCHPPVSLALALLREEYWVIGAKKLVKKVSNDCLTCKKARAKFLSQQMSPLPPDRVNPGFPFQKVGIDFGGPITIVMGPRRRVTQKVYICLFICLATKAIHLEAVTSLSANAFLEALHRFVSRRGRPSLIRSDNGTNFRGAYNELIRIIQGDTVQKSSAENGITWEFIPPSSPHFGGIWEAGIKSVKAFLRNMSNSKLNYEEFSTILTKIEGYLNSRPLSPLSDDVHDLEALTPGHFLIGRPLFAVPEQNLVDCKDNRDRFKIRQKLTQRFWNQWQTSYLHQLQQRAKWMNPQPNLEEGRLVLLREASSPQTWLMGRVVKLYPGTDGLVRVVDVRTPKGILKRPLVKLVPL